MNERIFNKQYYFDRDKFCECFMSVFDDDVFDAIYNGIKTDSYLFYRDCDEFYLIGLENGIIINWYKHLGRCNRCNVENFTKDDLTVFFQEFYKECVQKFHDEC